MGEALERVAEGVAEIEQRALAALFLVGGDDARLGGAARRDRLQPRRPAGEHRAPVAFEPSEEVAVADQAVFGHLGVAGAELARAQRVEDAGVGEHQRRLVEGADEVLAERRVDRRLAADAGIDLGEQGRRDLDEAHAAPQARRAEAGEIADDAAAERDDEVAPLDPRLDQRVADPREFGVGLGRFARRADDDRGRQPGRLEALQQRRRDAASPPSRR